MKPSILYAAFPLALLTACASSPVKYDTTKEARIRVFHSAGAYLHPNQACYAEDKTDAILASAGGFSMLAPNVKVGMPESEEMARSYSEFIINAGQPLTVEMKWAIHSPVQAGRKTVTSCGPLGVSFVPIAGKDYETWMLRQDQTCKVMVTELQPAQGVPAKTVPIETSPAPKCR